MSISDNKYQHGKIYKITDVAYNKCYIGSTVETLSNRMAKHRNLHKRWIQGTVKHSTCCSEIFEEFGMDNCKIELLEHFSCKSKDELNAREGFYIQNNDCVNKFVAGRTWKEYYNATKEQRLAYAKKHWQENKHKYLQPIQCDCGGQYLHSHKKRHFNTQKHKEFITANEENKTTEETE